MSVLELQQIGLSAGEARVYVALLSLKSSTVGSIIKESKVASSKIYEVLDRLIEKGLVSYVLHEQTKHFQVLPPKRLQDFLDEKEKEIEKNKVILKSILPQLEKFSDKNEEENVQIFKGKKGILTAYEIILDSLDENEEVKYFFSNSNTDSYYLQDFYITYPQFKEKLEKYYKLKGVTWKGLGPHNKGTIDPKWQFMQVKKTKFPIPGNYDITDNYVFIISWNKNPTGILIKSKDVAKYLRDYFNIMWG